MKTARKIAFELINDWQIPGELEDISVLEKRIERAITEAVEQALKAECERVSHLAKFYVEKNKQAITKAVEAERAACLSIVEKIRKSGASVLPANKVLRVAASAIRGRTPAKGVAK